LYTFINDVIKMPNQIIFILILCVHLYTLFLETDVTGRILVLSNGITVSWWCVQWVFLLEGNR